MKIMQCAVVGDVFYSNQYKVNVEVVHRDEGGIEFDNPLIRCLTHNDFPMCNKNYTCVYEYPSKFKVGDIVNDGRENAFVIRTGKRLTLQRFNSNHILYGVPEDHCTLIYSKDSVDQSLNYRKVSRKRVV